MKKNISKKSGLVSTLIIAVILSVLATTFAVFAEESTPEETTAVMTAEANDNISETIENNSEEITEENDSAEEVTMAEDDSTEDVTTAENDCVEEIAEVDNNSEETVEEDNNSIEPSSNETLVADEISNENLESQEDLVELAEEIPTAEDLTVADETILNCESVHYNAIYLGGLNINNVNWDHIQITVKDAKTGETHEGYLNYQNNNALLGYLTTGCFMDTNCTYTIEVQIHMPNEEVMIINGSSTGAASNGNGYSTISFAAEGYTEI